MTRLLFATITLYLYGFGDMNALASIIMMPVVSMGELEQVICNIVSLTQDDIGKPVATAGVMAMAALAVFGRVSWGPLMVTAAGIGIIFSASDIVSAATPLSPSCAGGGFSGAVKNQLCDLLVFVDSGLFAAISSGAVLILGCLAVFGKVQWGQAMIFGAGIGAANAASGVANYIAVGIGGGAIVPAAEFCGI